MKGDRVHIIGTGTGVEVRRYSDNLGQPIVVVRRDEDGVEHLCREFEFGKIHRMSVSHLGRPDRPVTSWAEVRAMLDGYAREEGRKVEIGHFLKSEKFKDYGCYGGVDRWWNRADWRFEGDDLWTYAGFVVVVLDCPKKVAYERKTT